MDSCLGGLCLIKEECMEFNINHKVSFVLTKSGAVTLNIHFKECNDLFIEKNFKARYKDDYEEGDEYRDQMWSIMEIFGGGSHLGSEAFCKNCIIEI